MNWGYVVPNLAALLIGAGVFCLAVRFAGGRSKLNRDDAKALTFAFCVVLPFLLLVGWSK